MKTKMAAEPDGNPVEIWETRQKVPATQRGAKRLEDGRMDDRRFKSIFKQLPMEYFP